VEQRNTALVSLDLGVLDEPAQTPFDDPVESAPGRGQGDRIRDRKDEDVGLDLLRRPLDDGDLHGERDAIRTPY
jgi:hypothetical protein